MVGCDSEENAEVGAFSSSLSAEEASVQDPTFTQKDTLCEEFAGYGDAKFQSLEDTYGCFGAVADATAGMDVEVTDPCAEEDKYLNCSATVAELEACGEEYATFSYLSAAAFFSGAAEVAEEQGAAPESEEEGGTEEWAWKVSSGSRRKLLESVPVRHPLQLHSVRNAWWSQLRVPSSSRMWESQPTNFRGAICPKWKVVRKLLLKKVAKKLLLKKVAKKLPLKKVAKKLLLKKVERRKPLLRIAQQIGGKAFEPSLFLFVTRCSPSSMFILHRVL